MKLAGRFLLVAGCSIAPFIDSCQSLTSDSVTVQAPAVETAQDQVLSKSVQERLRADTKADLSSVKVVSQDGTVYLTGTVTSLDARQQAVQIAWEVRGVKSVVNSLEVVK